MRSILYTLFFGILLLNAGCKSSQQAKYITNQGGIFGTYYRIVYEHPDGEDIHKQIRGEMHRLDSSLSSYKPESVLSKVNRNQSVQLDDYFRQVFSKAMEIAEKTEGAFDPTVAPLVNAWGFGFTNKADVTPEMVDSILQFVGHRKVRLEKDRVQKDDVRLMLDFSAIAKGYAVDKVAEFIHDAGCENYLVEIGGEVVARGFNPSGKHWRIGINEPNDNEPAVSSHFEAIVSLNSRALATSGNYRNFYVENGKKFAHTIDPLSGYPVDHSLLSATVLAKSCMAADAFATALMVMGVEKAKTLINEQDSLDVFLIYADENGENQLLMTKGFQSIVVE